MQRGYPEPALPEPEPNTTSTNSPTSAQATHDSLRHRTPNPRPAQSRTEWVARENLVRGAVLSCWVLFVPHRLHLRVAFTKVCVVHQRLSLSFLVTPAPVTDADLIDSQPSFRNFHCYLRLEAEPIFLDRNGLDHFSPKCFIAGLHITQVDVSEAIGNQRQD